MRVRDWIGQLGAMCIVAGLALSPAACRRPAAPTRRMELGRVDVAFSGCAEEVTADRCALDNFRRLRFWVADTKTPIQAWSDKGEIAVTAAVVQGGQAFDVDVPVGVSTLGVGTAEVAWRLLKIEPYVHDAYVDTANAALHADPAAASARLQSELGEMEALRVARLESLLGRAAMQMGDYASADRLLTHSSAVFKELKRTSRWLKDALALAFLYTSRLGKIAQTQQLLADCEPRLALHSAMRAEHAYQRGLVHSASGDIRSALAAFRLANTWAMRLRNDSVQLATQQWLAMTLMSLGRSDEALSIEKGLVAAHASAPDPCDRGPVFATASWVALHHQPIDVTVTQAWLREAATSLSLCKDPFRERNALLNEVWFAVQTQDHASARKHLSKLANEDAGKTTQLVILENEMWGRLALVEGKFRDADQAFTKAAALAGAAGFVDDQLRMTVARGSALLRSSRVAAAIKLFEDAERQLDRRLLLVPLGEGRTRFLSARDEGARGLVAAHLAAKNVGAAFSAARRARSRTLQSAILGERVGKMSATDHSRWSSALAEFSQARAQLELASASDWRLSQAELTAMQNERRALFELAESKLDEAYAILTTSSGAAPTLVPPSMPNEGELLLLYSARQASTGSPSALQWDAFAASSRAVHHAVVGAALGNTRTHAWLAPFTRAIAEAKALRVLFTSPVEIHALAFEGRPLLMQLPVVYALDVPSASAAKGSPLVVSNPTGDLPDSAAEGRALADVLAPSRPTWLSDTSADRSTVIGLLPKTGWFHYAGHSVFEGVDGLESGLPLAGGARLSAADVLALPASPALVVLSACEASRGADGSNTAGLGLAQAFVLAGSRAVVAPTRPVRDGFARQLMRLVYQHLLAGMPIEKALQTAERDSNVQKEGDWSAFRVLVP